MKQSQIDLIKIPPDVRCYLSSWFSKDELNHLEQQYLPSPPTHTFLRVNTLRISTEEAADFVQRLIDRVRLRSVTRIITLILIP